MVETVAITGITAAQQGLFDKALAFIQSIGIPILFRELNKPCFLPGLSIENGAILIDMDKLKYPGDILHEAGHIAVIPAGDRGTLNADAIKERPMRDAEEMMAIAWSYAACKYLDIDARFVFHDEGYQKGGSHIADNFDEGRYFGVPMLQWTGMALERKKEEEPDLPVYPAMLKWMRE
jgi:hypothetical protein